MSRYMRFLYFRLNYYLLLWLKAKASLSLSSIVHPLYKNKFTMFLVFLQVALLRLTIYQTLKYIIVLSINLCFVYNNTLFDYNI